jgi:hypothetical protein
MVHQQKTLLRPFFQQAKERTKQYNRSWRAIHGCRM